MHYGFLFFVLADQITKAFFAGRDFFLFGLHLHPMANYALPFGIDFGAFWNAIILLVVYIAVGYLVVKTKFSGRVGNLGKAMFLAGAASNLADRLIYGYVRDFIDISLGFVFNFADIFIALGLLGILLSRNEKIDKVEKTEPTGESYQK